MKRDDTKKNFTSLSGNDLQTVRLHYPSFPCIIAIVPVSRLLNLMRYSSVLNANIRFFCSENRNFKVKMSRSLKKNKEKGILSNPLSHHSYVKTIILFSE